VWPSSYSSNTNEILWGAKAAARMPWVACVETIAHYIEKYAGPLLPRAAEAYLTGV
jgi:hypothetical protein